MRSTQLGKHTFEYPFIMNAAGTYKTVDPEALNPAIRLFDAAIAGTITPQPRSGNTGKCEDFESDLYGLNSWGMPNGGIESASLEGSFGPLHDSNTPVIVSVAGFSVMDYLTLFRKLALWGAGLELNFGCPNIREGHVQHKIASFDLEYMEEVLRSLYAYNVASSIILGVKLSPYSDPGLLREVAEMLSQFHELSYVATCNTFPNGLGYNPTGGARLHTDEAGKWGGISGEALKPISLSNAAQFRENLPAQTAVIRVGGISSAMDVHDTYRAGCQGVQIGTAFMKRGPNLITEIRTELAELAISERGAE